jgi:hypothetical protein
MIPLIVRVPAVEVQAEAAFAGDDADVHVFCCNEDVALCGESLEGDFYDEDQPTDCIRCDVIDEADVPCGARFCRLRSWWRNRRSS